MNRQFLSSEFLRVLCASVVNILNLSKRGAFMRLLLGFLAFLFVAASCSHAGEPKKRVLLLWQKPDGHPKGTHEYELSQRILKRELDKFPSLDAVMVNADDPWKDGPSLLAKADGVVLFVSEGAMGERRRETVRGISGLRETQSGL